MSRTVLQVPMTKSLRGAAESAAIDYGFSSLQETVRVFLKKLATKQITISFDESARPSPAAEKRYMLMDKDFDADENIYEADSVKELMDQLNED